MNSTKGELERPPGTPDVLELPLERAIDLIDAINPLGGLFIEIHESLGLVFRGQADSTWGLTPAVFRPRGTRAPAFWNTPAYGARVRLEIDQLKKFAERLDAQGLIIPGDGEEPRRTLKDIDPTVGWTDDPVNLREWPPKELVPLMALAQHYGLPTRLLDWSDSPYVAAYFAAEAAVRAYESDRSGDGASRSGCSVPVYWTRWN